MKVTGKVEPKPYKCRSCGHEETYSTNHYGTIYGYCNVCSWKSPTNPTKAFDCLTPLPEGWAKPEEWKQVTLGEVMELGMGNLRK